VQAVLAEEEPEGKEDLRPFAKRRAFYVYSTTILRKYEGRGLGAILKAYVIGRVFEAGCRWVVGHAKEGERRPQAPLRLSQRNYDDLARRSPVFSSRGGPRLH
jgi:hypothetical protein